MVSVITILRESIFTTRPELAIHGKAKCINLSIIIYQFPTLGNATWLRIDFNWGVFFVLDQSILAQ